MVKKTKTKQGKIKPKVLFGYLIILGIALAALGITYKGFIDLTQTRQTISEPSQKLIKLNSIITDIYEAESNIRTYTLTQNESYLSIYLGFMKNINLKVDSLLTLSQNDPVQTEKIKFIQELLNRKRRVLRELIELKKTDQTSRFYSKALEEVESLNLDSVRESAVITSVTTTTKSRRDSVINVEPDLSTQSAFSRLLRWFSKKETEDSTITKLIVEVETQVDTLRKSVMSPSDSLLNEVVKILTAIQEQQEMAMYNIGEKELELLKSDKEIMDQIRTVLSLLEREELMNSYNMAEEVKTTVKESTIMLLGLGGFALLMTILFTWTIFRDLSKASYYRNQLVNAKQYAEKLLRIKEDFLANMNHEIRTPLSAIVGLSKQLERTSLGNEQHALVESLNSSSQHLLQIVNDILDLTKIDGNYLKIEKTPFNLKNEIEIAFKTLKVKAEEKGFYYNLKASDLVNSTVIGDSLRLKQIVINLLSNAIKFTSKGGITLNVDSSVEDNQTLKLKLIVSDTGIGIPAEKLESIFEQFSQVDSSTSRLYGGTGLGLTIVKKLTELQQGSISVSSEIGKGSTFIVQLTYPLASERQLQKSELYHTLKLPNELRVLAVDDDPIGQLLINEMLKVLGVSATVVGSATQAIELAKSNSFSVIITDIQMPGLNGFELSKSIKKTVTPPLPTIAISANSNIANQNEYAEAGFYSYLVKPFSEVDLFNVLAPLAGKEMVNNKISNEQNEHSDYDISDIRRFANDDDQSTYIILQSFVENSVQNLATLKIYISKADWKAVGEMAHKMKSAFRQLKVTEVASTLESLENINEKTNANELAETLAIIEAEVNRINLLLKADMAKIKAS